MPHLVTNGTIISPVKVAGFVELQLKARVTDDVEYEMIEIHPGAVIQCHLTDQEGLNKARLLN